MAYVIEYEDGIFAGTYVHQGEKFPYPASETVPPKKWKSLKMAEKALEKLPSEYGGRLVEVEEC